MDPNTTLKMLREAIQGFFDACDGDSADDEYDCAVTVAGMAEALDEWLTKGGFLPDAWGPATTFSLAEIRNGTGWPKGVRFAIVEPEPDQVGVEPADSHHDLASKLAPGKTDIIQGQASAVTRPPTGCPGRNTASLRPDMTRNTTSPTSSTSGDGHAIVLVVTSYPIA